MYRIVLTQRALKDLENIDKEMQSRIAAKLKEYAEDPLKHARKLIHPSIGTYRLRIGDYRVIFDINHENIVILRIGHRKCIYK
ncbi:MAG: type II toxin-antitoxin system RelE/ParE family toxin [Methanothrix sp.]|uniref:type II toxin-antitoxin system RelE family toxin n=1 Tax=Methanothrix sp. TaxID=90426 RepID=UPI0032AE88EF|nr:type II toxin-antitoxin system RelE/ParE family toxin [Methanothrix sp.]